MKKIVTMGMVVIVAVSFEAVSYAATIRAMVRDANLFLVGTKVDHAYVCIDKSCYALPGGTTGGTELRATRGTGTGTKAKCAATVSKCKITWGITGTCQQGANRMLREINKSVYFARGYNITSALFGPYGTSGSWSGCRQTCSL